MAITNSAKHSMTWRLLLPRYNPRIYGFRSTLFYASAERGSKHKFEASDVPAEIGWSPRMSSEVSTTSGHPVMDLLRARLWKSSLLSPSATSSLKDAVMNFHPNEGDPFLQDVLKYISQTLMEENSEEGYSANLDPSTLLANENALYDVLEKKFKASQLYNPVHVVSAEIFQCSILQDLWCESS